jgi:hypothetical protein
MDKKRGATQDASSVIGWFKEYEALPKRYGIRAQDLLNFDETGFRLACAGGLEVWVPVEIKGVSS